MVAARSSKTGVPNLGHTSTIDLPDGTTVTKGDFVNFKGEAGAFRFNHARLGELTVWGPLVNGMKDSDGKAAPWNSAQWRTFRADQVINVSTVATMVETVQTVLAADGSGDYASMSPGQKAAYTKRMRAMTAVAA